MAWADAARALIRVWNERLDEHLLEVVASHAAQGAAPVFGKAVRIAFDGIAAHLAAPCDLLLRGCRLLDLDDLVLCRVVAIVVRGGLGGRLAAQHAMVVIVGDGRSLAHDLGALDGADEHEMGPDVNRRIDGYLERGERVVREAGEARFAYVVVEFGELVDVLAGFEAEGADEVHGRVLREHARAETLAGGYGIRRRVLLVDGHEQLGRVGCDLQKRVDHASA